MQGRATMDGRAGCSTCGSAGRAHRSIAPRLVGKPCHGRRTFVSRTTNVGVFATATLTPPTQQPRTGIPKPVQRYYREQAPWPTDIPLQQHDLLKAPYVDLVVAGAGPAGAAIAARVAEAGYRVCVIDPAPLGVWPNNYGVWVDEFEAMGLEDCLEVIWPKAKVWLDNNKQGER